MSIIKSQVDTISSDFAANDAYMRELVADLQTPLDLTALGGEKRPARNIPVVEKCWCVSGLKN